MNLAKFLRGPIKNGTLPLDASVFKTWIRTISLSH